MLSDDQIDQLFIFCKKHHVGHYDIQVELVDHLANAIEEKLEKDPTISFETALNSVHADFGVLGFAGVVNARSAALEKQYRKMKWKLFVSYFTWPKAAMTACLFLALSFPYKFLPANNLPSYTNLIVSLLFIFQVYVWIQSYRQIKKQTRKLMMTYIGPQQTWFLSFWLIQFANFDFYSAFSGKSLPVLISFELCILITVVFFTGILAFRDMENQLDAQARKQYPEAFAIAK